MGSGFRVKGVRGFRGLGLEVRALGFWIKGFRGSGLGLFRGLLFWSFKGFRALGVKGLG